MWDQTAWSIFRLQRVDRNRGDAAMRMNEQTVCVAGVGMTQFSPHARDYSIVDLARIAIDKALEDAKTDADSIDELVFANESDHLSGQVTLVSMVQADCGLVDKPALRVEAGGATGAAAIRTGVAAIRSGSASAVIVCGAEKTGRQMSSGAVGEVFALSADSQFEYPVGVTFPALYAMMIQAHCDRYGTTMEQVAQVSVKNLRNGMRNPLAHRGLDVSVGDVRGSVPVATPYNALDCSVLSDGAAAVVLASKSWMEAGARPRRERIVIAGSGAATDQPRLGDRIVDGLDGLCGFAAKRTAAARAYSQAGVISPVAEIDVAEVYDSFSGAEVQAYEALGFCDIGAGGVAAERGDFDFGGKLVVNASGGLIARGAASGATGVAQMVEVVEQLRHEAGDRQVPDARRGLTDTHAGIGSICMVHVLERVDT